MNLKGGLKLWLIVVLVGVFTLTLPMFVSLYNLHIAICILENIIIALGWNILAMTGQISLGTAGFFGLGAYTAVFLSELTNFPIILNIVIGGVASAVASLFVGLICLRMRGLYFAITTLCLSEASKVTIFMLHDITLQPVGTSVPIIFNGSKLYAYYFILAVGLLSLGAQFYAAKSKLFYAFSAIRIDEDSASMIGVNPTLYKILAFIVSSFLIGLCGGFYPFYRGYIEPEVAFSVSISILGVIMPLLGGLHTTFGPVLGAITLTLLSENLRFLLVVNQLVYGLILIAAILFMPKGIIGGIEKWRAKFLRSREVSKT